MTDPQRPDPQTPGEAPTPEELAAAETAALSEAIEETEPEPDRIRQKRASLSIAQVPICVAVM